MKAKLNLGEKTIKAMNGKEEYKGILSENGKEVEYTILPQPAISKKMVQAHIVLENGEEWTVFKDQLIIEEEIKKRTLKIPKKEIEKLVRAGIYEDLIDANGKEVEYTINPQPAISKEMVIANVVLNGTPYGINLKYLK